MTDERLEARVGAVLREKGLTVCAAESCTGGLVMSRLTDVAGSSDYVPGGIVAYSNQVKQKLLSVREETIIAHGAVSEEVVREMAMGVRAIFGTDFAVSVTGIAGPGGGTDKKPVGLTFIGLAGPDGLLTAQRHVWNGNRIENKMSSADAALQIVLDAAEKY